MKSDLGLMHIYSGDGKGKTTAAIGLTIRVSGYGLKVLFSQFLKNWDTGELNSFAKMENVTVIRNTKPFPFTNKMTEKQQQEIKEIHNNLFKRVMDELKTGEYSMLVLDEIISTYNLNMIDRNIVDEFLQNRPANVELVLTGRDPSDAFVEMADYVSEITKIKHPYDNGILARKAIEE